jgi:hypothetical protein
VAGACAILLLLLRLRLPRVFEKLFLVSLPVL